MTDPIKNFYENGKWYELTINANDSNQYFDAPLRDIRSRGYYKKLVKEIFANSSDSFVFFFELSEPKSGQKHGSTPRIHVHGILRFNDVYQFLLHGHYRLSQSTSFQFNDYRPDYWPKYITKQQLIINKHLPYFRHNTKALPESITALLPKKAKEEE